MKCLALALFLVIGAAGCSESSDGEPSCQCPTIYAPVCGIDGITYGNSCLAQCEDIEIAYEGACDECEGDGDCEPDEICVDWPPEEAAVCIWVGCDRDDQCRPGEHCVIDDICRAPADVGPCDAVFPRWFYNSDTGECEEFIWGGCGGNANNFETKEECEAMCPSLVSKLTIAPRAGHCEPEPVACPLIYAPVCSVNAETYGNSCQAEAAGVQVAYDGECITGDETCRDRGCPDDWTCARCPSPDYTAEWICLSPEAGACESES